MGRLPDLTHETPQAVAGPTARDDEGEPVKV